MNSSDTLVLFIRPKRTDSECASVFHFVVVAISPDKMEYLIMSFLVIALLTLSGWSLSAHGVVHPLHCITPVVGGTNQLLGQQQVCTHNKTIGNLGWHQHPPSFMHLTETSASAPVIVFYI